MTKQWWTPEQEARVEAAIARVPASKAARAALEAMPEPDPLEDVLGDLNIMQVWRRDGEWHAEVYWPGNTDRYKLGTGSTISDAIRSAVAAAKGGAK